MMQQPSFRHFSSVNLISHNKTGNKTTPTEVLNIIETANFHLQNFPAFLYFAFCATSGE